MAGRYSKQYSNYILRKKTQDTSKGNIWERDWVTIGAQHQIEPGKRPYYSDGNFLYTDNATPPSSRRLKIGKKIGEWRYDDVKDAKPFVNQVIINQISNDLRDYAYYGSSVEMVKAAITNVLTWFPGNAESKENPLSVPVEFYMYLNSDIFVFTDDFNINDIAEDDVYCQVNEFYYIKVTNDMFSDTSSEGYIPFGRNVNKGNRYVENSSEETLYYIAESYMVSVETYQELSDDDKKNYTYKSPYKYVSDALSENKGYDFGSYVWGTTDAKELRNPFNIDFFHTNISESFDTNVLRFLTKSYRNYRINGEEIVEYNVSRWKGEKTCPQNDVYKNVISITVGTPKFYIGRAHLLDKTEYNSLSDAEKYDYCIFFGNVEDIETIEDNDKRERYLNDHFDYYISTHKLKDTPDDVFNEKIYSDGATAKYVQNTIIVYRDEYSRLTEEEKTLFVGFGVNSDKYEFNGFMLDDGGMSYTVSGLSVNDGGNERDFDVAVDIRPRAEIIEAYFDGLSGFEAAMLNRKSDPLYSMVLKSPIETKSGTFMVEDTYTWPSYGYCVDVETGGYFGYVDKLTKLAQFFDDNWTDNLWRNMTHESIKNFDWTYTREYSDGEEDDYIDGGSRMEQLIRVYGRLFDDIKRYVDGIKLTNIVTYDSRNNMPDAELSDKLNVMGWDIFSTIPSFEGDTEDLSTTYLTSEFVEAHSWKNSDTTHPSWFRTLTPENYTAANMDINFNRELTLSSKFILASKGTLDSIDMVFGLFGIGQPDYSIKERYFFTYPKDWSEELISEIAHINGIEDSEELSEVYFGVPLNTVEMMNKKFVVPFYAPNKFYYDDFYFQSFGGWGKDGMVKSTKEITNFDDSEYGESGQNNVYMETLSYLKVVYDVYSLLTENPFSVNRGDIYYVTNLAYVNEDNNTPEEFKSHFFICDNEYRTDDLNEGWHSIDLDEDTEESKTAKYLESIIPTQIGNNPHVGFGQYDLGDNYLNNMERPFNGLFNTYSSDNEGYDEDFNERRNESYGITFDLSEMETNDNDIKVKNLVSKYLDETKLIEKTQSEISAIESYINSLIGVTDGDDVVQYYYSKINKKNGIVSFEDFDKYHILGAGGDSVVVNNDERDYVYHGNRGFYEGNYKGDKVLDIVQSGNELYVNVMNDEDTYTVTVADAVYKKGNNNYFVKCSNDGIYYKSLTSDDYNGLPDNEKQNYFYHGDYCDRVSTEERAAAMEELNQKRVLLEKLTDVDISKYYLNSKVLILKNNLDGELYKKYFLDVIVKYIMQVIPSTTILVLEGFNKKNE